MAFIQPQVLLMLFRRFNAGGPITLEALTAYDSGLDSRLRTATLKALDDANVNDKSDFAVATVVGLALLGMGGADQLKPAAVAYKKAIDNGIIG